MTAGKRIVYFASVVHRDELNISGGELNGYC